MKRSSWEEVRKAGKAEEKLKAALRNPKRGKPRLNRKESILLFWTQN